MGEECGLVHKAQEVRQWRDQEEVCLSRAGANGGEGRVQCTYIGPSSPQASRAFLQLFSYPYKVN